MKRSTLARLAAVLAFAAVGTVAPGCGGGGGSTPCGLPGTLAALALEGAAAPGTTGVFGAIAAQVDAQAADGGWVAFVADVTGGAPTKGLFAAEPNGTVHLVYAKGDLLPALGTGTIFDFQRVFVTSGGAIVTLVTTTLPPSFAILTALIDGTGAVVDKTTVVKSTDLLPQMPGNPTDPLTISAIDANLMQVDDQGSTIFSATGTGGGTPPHGIYRVNLLGTLFEPLAQTGDTVAGADGGTFTLTSQFDNLAIDGDGVLIAYTSTHLVSGAGLIVVTNGTTPVVIAKDTDPAPNSLGRTFTDVSNGVLAVNEASPNGYVFWQAGLSGGAPSTGLFYRQVSPTVGAITALAVPGGVATQAGPSATISTMRLLEPENDPSVVTLEADITGGDTFRIYFSIPAPGSLNEIWRQGEVAPDAPGGLASFTLTYPSTTLAHRSVTDRIGSPAFTAVLSDGSTGVWWARRLCGFFKVALEGEAAPGTVGGTFTSFATPSTVSVAGDNLVFRAAIGGGTNPTGLFRQH